MAPFFFAGRFVFGFGFWGKGKEGGMRADCVVGLSRVDCVLWDLEVE